MNQVILIGNLCRDIDLRKAANDSHVGSTAIAVRRDRKNEKGEYDADFFDVKLFGNQADFAYNYLKKGDRVCISGRVQIRDYVNKEGIKGRAIEVLVNSIESLESKDTTNDDAVEEVPVTKQEAPVVEEIPDDDLPF